VSQHYIAGYDGSDSAEAAAQIARLLGHAQHIDVVVANVYTAAWLWEPAEAFAYEQARAEIRARSVRLLDELDLDGVERRAVLSDSPSHGLHDLAVELDARLLAVGTTHRGMIGRLSAGSVPLHLLTGAPCPVLVAPEDSGTKSIRTIGVALNNTPEARAALACATRLAEAVGATLNLYAAYQPIAVTVPIGTAARLPNDTEERLEQLLEHAAGSIPIPTETQIIMGSPAAALADVTEDVDLFVTGSRSYEPMRAVLLGSVSRHQVDHAACPVVVVPRPHGR
jgi:nucleotide-binding universal stress UspA family protein